MNPIKFTLQKTLPDPIRGAFHFVLIAETGHKDTKYTERRSMDDLSEVALRRAKKELATALFYRIARPEDADVLFEIEKEAALTPKIGRFFR